jgi:hypothetical protein
MKARVGFASSGTVPQRLKTLGTPARPHAHDIPLVKHDRSRFISAAQGTEHFPLLLAPLAGKRRHPVTGRLPHAKSSKPLSGYSIPVRNGICCRSAVQSTKGRAAEGNYRWTRVKSAFILPVHRRIENGLFSSFRIYQDLQGHRPAVRRVKHPAGRLSKHHCGKPQ